MEPVMLKKILNSSINARMKEFFQSDRPKIIYGAGNQAQACVGILRQIKIPMAYLATRDGQTRAQDLKEPFLFVVAGKELPHYKVDVVPERDKREMDILIAVNERYNDEIGHTLQEHGFENIYWSDSWKMFNEELRGAIFNQYLEERVPGYKEDAPLIEFKGFRLMNDRSVTYSSMLFEEFYDIVSPSIFQDYSRLTEGAYEQGEVCLEKDDVVLDLGANIGVFSCVAASKGCRVYAFEPTPLTIELLRKNQALYAGGGGIFRSYLMPPVTKMGQYNSIAIRKRATQTHRKTPSAFKTRDLQRLM